MIPLLPVSSDSVAAAAAMAARRHPTPHVRPPVTARPPADRPRKEHR